MYSSGWADRPLRYPIRLWVGGCAGLVKVEYLAWKSRDRLSTRGITPPYRGGLYTVPSRSPAVVAAVGCFADD